MAKIVTDGLIFAYDPANRRTYEGDGGGTSSTEIVGDLTGTITNGAEYLNQNGGVFSLDGSNDYIDFGNDAVTPALPFSVQVWVNFPTLGTNEPTFVSSYHSSNYFGFWTQKNPSNLLKMHIGDGATAASSNRRTGTGPTVTNNVWYNVAFVFRGTTDMSIYVDGVAQSVSYDGTGGALDYGSGKPSRIGYFRTHYGELKMTQLLIYDKGLSADEVVQNYNSARGRFLT